MKRILYFATILFLGLGSFASAQGEVDASLQQKYASNCEFVKSDFKTYIRPNDLKTRLDRVRIYEKIISDQNLIYKRLKANNQYRAGIKEVISKQANNLASFKQKFELYDSSAKKILDLDCSTKSDNLYVLVIDARTKRLDASTTLNNQGQVASEALVIMESASSHIGGREDD